MKTLKIKNSTVVLVLALLATSSVNLSSTFAEEKPKYGPLATPLSESNQYFRTHPSPLFWRIIPYYSAQETEGSCSVASVVMVMNALRSKIKLTSEEPLVTHTGLLEKPGLAAWKKAVGPLGRGVGLDQLAEFVKTTLKAYKIEDAKVEVVHVENDSKETLQRLHSLLTESEQTGENGTVFVIANFLQGSYTGDADVGHLSPIGAYQPDKQVALVLDSDRKWYEPYWVSLKTLAKGMATSDKQNGKTRGYLVIRRAAGG